MSFALSRAARCSIMQSSGMINTQGEALTRNSGTILAPRPADRLRPGRLSIADAVANAGRLQFLRLTLSIVISITLAISPALAVQAGKGGPAQASHSAASSNAPGRGQPFRSRPSVQALRWARAQLRQMSLDEKIGQLISIGVSGKFVNRESDFYRDLRHQVEENHIGGIVLYRGAVYESVQLVNRMQQLARYPLLISADMEFGAGMRFDDTVSLPWNMALGATGNPQYAYRQGEIIAREARALGVRQVFGPVADVNNNAANPVINVRSYSEDPQAVAEFSAAFIKGAQANGVIATAKHFPGHGNTVVDSHRGLPVINLDRDRLKEVELVPFKAAIAAGVGSVMAAYISLPKIDATPIQPLSRDRTARSYDGIDRSEILTAEATLPAALSPVALSDLLRGDLQFDGLIVTDALDMSGLTIYFDPGEAAVRAVAAGADMLIKPPDPDAAVRGLRQAVQTKRISEARIEQSVARILAAKYDLGLTQQRITPLDQIDTLLSNPQAVAFAREVAERAITLVRNDANLLPLKLQPNAKLFNLAITNGDDRLSIAAPFVEEMARQGRPVETIVLDGRSSDAEIRQAVKQAQDAALTIVSLYGRVRTGESRSIGLPEAPANALTELIKRHTPLIGISFGNPYLLQSFSGLQTYMIAYGDMPSLQEAAARALLGETAITGKLPITLPVQKNLYQRGTGIELNAEARKSQRL